MTTRHAANAIHTYELTPTTIRRLLQDALVLAAAVTVYVPMAESRPHRSARRVMRALMPSRTRCMEAVAAITRP